MFITAQLTEKMQRAVIITLIGLFVMRIGASMVAEDFLDDGFTCSPIACATCKCRHENYTRMYEQVEEMLDNLVEWVMKELRSAKAL